MHEGAVSAELGLAGWPSVAESLMVERDLSLAGYESRPVAPPAPLGAGVRRRRQARARGAGAAVSAEASPHHLCATDELVRTLDANVKMNPPLRTEDDRRALVEGLLDGTIDCVATDHAPHARHEKDVPFEEAPFGVTGLETAFGALNTFLVRDGRGPAADAARAALRRAGARARAARAADRGGGAREPRAARPRGGVDGARGRLPLPLGELVASRAHARRRGRQDDRRRTGGLRGVSAPTHGYVLLEDGTVFPGRSVAAEGAAFGEVVFTTGMTGYQETVTDPSYAGQLVCFTAPMIGNYGVGGRAARVGDAARARGPACAGSAASTGRSGSPSVGSSRSTRSTRAR